MVITETLEDGIPTGWKLIRIPLASFGIVGEHKWNDVPTIRMRLESAESSSQLLKIAKIELVENDWQEIGVAQKDTLSSFKEDPLFSVSVINTDESTEYKNSLNDLDIVLEHDEYNDIDIKEQSLVIAFERDYGCIDNFNCNQEYGIKQDTSLFIKKNFNYSQYTTEQRNSFFAYDNMEMLYKANRNNVINNNVWFNEANDCSEEVELAFRIGKDDNYYEIRQPLNKDQHCFGDTLQTKYCDTDWNNIKINLGELTRYKKFRNALDYPDDGVLQIVLLPM